MPTIPYRVVTEEKLIPTSVLRALNMNTFSTLVLILSKFQCNYAIFKKSQEMQFFIKMTQEGTKIKFNVLKKLFIVLLYCKVHRDFAFYAQWRIANNLKKIGMENVHLQSLSYSF